MHGYLTNQLGMVKSKIHARCGSGKIIDPLTTKKTSLLKDQIGKFENCAGDFHAGMQMAQIVFQL